MGNNIIKHGFWFNPINIENDTDINKILNNAEVDDKTKKEIFDKIKSYGNLKWVFSEHEFKDAWFTSNQERKLIPLIDELIKITGPKINQKFDPWYNIHDKYAYLRMYHFWRPLLTKYVKHFHILDKEYENMEIVIGPDYNIKATYKEIIEIIHNSKEADFAEKAKAEFEKHTTERANISRQ